MFFYHLYVLIFLPFLLSFSLLFSNEEAMTSLNSALSNTYNKPHSSLPLFVHKGAGAGKKSNLKG